MNRSLDVMLQSLKSSLSGLKPGKIGTIFIGGGTPSLISPDSLDRFLKSLHDETGQVEEFSIEVNPESLSREFLEVLSTNQVNRISMGVQTYDERLLAWLGRPAGIEALERADDLLSRYWNRRLSRDLLASLPGGSERLLEDIKRAISDNPGHLSIYELTVESGTALASDQKSLDELPDEKTALSEWAAALKYLKTHGYRRYEVSNFAIPGEESQHNLGYWRMYPYLGIGAGAVSTIPGGKDQVIRREVHKDLLSWLDSPSASYSETILETGEFALEHFMMGLRTSEGLSVDRFRSVFGISPLDVAPYSLNRWRDTGALEYGDSALKTTENGMEFIDAMLADIAAEADKVSWPAVCRWPQP